MKILFVSAHTDDAEFGAGGMIAKLMDYPLLNDLYWVVFSAASNILVENHLPPDMLRKEWGEVVRECGLREGTHELYDFESRLLPDHSQEIIQILDRIKDKFTPDLVVSHSLHDTHQDHKTIADNVISVFKKSSSVICYELPWNHLSFDTQFFVRLERRHVERKWSLISKYKSQFQLKKPYFSEDLVYGMARTRGSQVSCEFAEAFEVLRWII